MAHLQACAFCQQPATMTGEHVWSDWLNTTRVPSTYTVKYTNPETQVVKSWRSDSFNLKARVVCAKCNNGWMSELENKEAKPILSQMIDLYRTFSLLPGGAASIATFLFKTAIVADHMHPSKKPFFQPSTRRRFATSLQIPTGIQMWLAGLGTYSAANGVLLTRYNKKNIGAIKGIEFYTFTFGIGRLLLQLHAPRWIKSSKRPVIFPLVRQHEVWNAFANKFWPIEGLAVGWPPQKNLSDNAINQFADRWAYLNVPRSFR